METNKFFNVKQYIKRIKDYILGILIIIGLAFVIVYVVIADFITKIATNIRIVLLRILFRLVKKDIKISVEEGDRRYPDYSLVFTIYPYAGALAKLPPVYYLVIEFGEGFDSYFQTRFNPFCWLRNHLIYLLMCPLIRHMKLNDEELKSFLRFYKKTSDKIEVLYGGKSVSRFQIMDRTNSVFTVMIKNVEYEIHEVGWHWHYQKSDENQITRYKVRDKSEVKVIKKHIRRMIKKYMKYCIYNM